jgi:anti-sigma regulatory factor (Ser/Thr protein kinase)
MSESLEVELARDRGASRVARQLLADRFGTSLTADELDTMRLLVSELVNNAVIHGQGRSR